MLRPDDIYIAIPWSRTDVIEACVDVFLRTPAEIHLGSQAILERFKEARVVQFGPTAGLGLTRPPLTRLQRAEKRAFDLVAATLGLIALAPLFALVALRIRWEGPGPVLFRHTRYGFNQEPFRIFKFRTMTTMEDGAEVKAATRCDPRVTRVGAFLRRFSIDELPQLLNVLMGEMSIVGPRPHALAHDQRYVERISRYARRHNVKPGITGWAQVSGHRGEILNDEGMQARIEHDLYYVDNWSLWLDVKIVLMTIISVSAHKNAY
jgi:exopolysaccharide biosynthesis polyprenyl glycosylphosphotransferase